MAPIYDIRPNGEPTKESDGEVLPQNVSTDSSGEEMASLNEHVYPNQEAKSADGSETKQSSMKESLRSVDVRSVRGSLISILRSVETVDEQVGVCAKNVNQEDFRTVQKESLNKLKDIVTSLISMMEEAEYEKENNLVQSSVGELKSEQGFTTSTGLNDIEKLNEPVNRPSADKLPIYVQVNEMTTVTFSSKRKFHDTTGKQFIQKKSATLEKIKQLNLSARFVYENMEILLNNDRCLMVIDNDFVAEVRIKNPGLLDETCNFEQAKSVLFSQLRIVQVLLDEQTKQTGNNHKLLLDAVEDILKRTTVDRKSGITCARLLKIMNMLKQTKKLTDGYFLEEMDRSNLLDDTLKEQVHCLLKEEQKKRNRKTLLKQLGVRLEDESSDLLEDVQKLLKEHFEQHKSILIASAPSFKVISDERLIMVTEKNVKLFAELREDLNLEIFSQHLNDLEDKWIREISSIEADYFDREMQLTNDIFFYLCKSLEELILEICERTQLQPKDLLKSSSSGWQPIGTITWNEESLETQSLERQYYFMFRLLDHFKLGVNYSQHSFEYQLQILIEPSIGASSYQEVHNISDKLYVWYCLIDDTLANVVSENFPDELKESILQWYLELIHAKNHDKLEAVRVVSHNVLLFIITVSPFISSPSTSDRQIFQKQMTIICSRKHSNRITIHLIREFHKFWKCKREVIDEITIQIPIPEMKLLQKQLVQVFLLALEKCVEAETLLLFLSTFESFLFYMGRKPFEWYIKSISDIDMQSVANLKKIELVDNELKETKHRSYRVVDSKKFPGLYRMLVEDDSHMPRHYAIEILSKMVSHVVLQLERHTWISNEKLTEIDQLSTACELLSVIHHAVSFLRNQAEYESFELFYQEKLKFFIFVCENTTSRPEFSVRCRLIKKSFEHQRQQDEVGEDTMFERYGKLNPTNDVQLLRQLYSEYCEQFEAFIYPSFGKNYLTAAAIVTTKVKEMISNTMHFSKWDTIFKKQTLPNIIAGLAAVWSILESKDFESTGWHPSPYCGQILCIFRLLSVDKPTSGIDKHLAQLCPREGKSLVLAIVAALLALMGHDVSIVCYSSYLAQRDRKRFSCFYDTLNVERKVSISSMEAALSQKNEAMNHLHFGSYSKESNEAGLTNIMLIDDVECFDEIKDRKLHMISTVIGLDEIQVFIWKIINEGCLEAKVVEEEVWKFTQLEKFSVSKEFEQFINSENQFYVWNLHYRCPRAVTYNNKSLLVEQLGKIINCAIEVFKNPSSFSSNYYLNSEGLIIHESNASHYYKAFNYFRLMKDSFVPQIKGQYNYGYLDIRNAFNVNDLFSKCYSLVLGVSGIPIDHRKNTLLCDEECSVFPTRFTNTNVKDMGRIENSSDRLEKIFNKTNDIICQNRSVIIVFESDSTLNAFKVTYGIKFERINVLTESTDEKEKIIAEAGIAKTVTLVTKEMGIGVDFKYGEMLEKNGGFHVIQACTHHYHFESRVGKKGTFHKFI